MSADVPFDEVRERFVTLLLSGSSIAAASTDCGITARTGRRWVAEDAMRRRLDEERADIRRETRERVDSVLSQCAVNAVIGIVGVANNEANPPAVRLRAYVAVLDICMTRLDNADLRADIDELLRERDERRASHAR